MHAPGKNRLTQAHRPSAAGFSLIELMVVVAIIGILSAIAFPAYTDYIQRGKAAEATSTLAGARIRIEQFFQDNRTYTGFANCPTNTKNFNYTCTIAGNPVGTAYTLTATGQTGGNMSGFVFTVNQNNVRTSVFDSTTGTNCWLSSRDGSC